MTNAIRFTIPGEPVAKGRARASIRNGRISHHTPDQTRAYESLVAWTARAAMGSSSPISGPVALSIVATWPIPPSWSKKRQQEAIGSAKTSRPDFDNVLKAICDGCNGIVWHDDAQVVELLHCRKIYGHSPGVVVEVTT